MAETFDQSIQIDERTKYVLSAFIRDIHAMILNDNHWDNIYSIIPEVIVTILLSYIGTVCNMNVGIYEWKVTDPKLLKSILQCDNRAAFESNEFEIGKLKWKIELFPNGNHQQRVGLFGVFVKCMGLPSDWEYILILRTIECIETASKYTFITRAASGQSKGWASGTLFLKDAKHVKSLTFRVKIRILLIAKDIGNYKTSRHTYYRYKSPYKYVSDLWDFNISWRINSQLMKKFKGCRHGQIFEQENITNDMWLLRCCPKGMKGGVNGECVLILQLCSLPFDISKMEMNYTLSCYECTHGSEIVSNSNTVIMHYENSVVKWTNDLLFFVQIKDFDEIEFRANIYIKRKIDTNNSSISKPSPIEAEWNKLIEQQSDDYYRDRKLLIMKGMINSLQEQVMIQNRWIRTLEHKLSTIKASSNEYNKINIDENEVANWLKTVVHLEEYSVVFVNNGLDSFDALKQIEIKHLESIGIDKIGHRLQLMKYIKQLG